MSWWDTGNKDDVIGDEPADLVRHALTEIAQTRAQRAQEKPKLADLLHAVVTVALTSRGKLLEKTPSGLKEIVVELKSGETVSSVLLQGAGATSDIVRLLTENLGQVAAVYRERWQRNPRFSEWLETLSFVLRYRPEEFLHDGQEFPLSELSAPASSDH